MKYCMVKNFVEEPAAEAAGLLGSWVRAPQSTWICSSVVFVVNCVGSGLCDQLITRSEESCPVCVCVKGRVRERSINLDNEAAWARVVLSHHKRKKICRS